MIGQPFINPVLSHAIEMYLKYKDHPEDPNFSEFTVMVVRTLVFIYGELDILNPYITHNEHMMGGFDSNITKYGFSIDALTDFKNQFLKFVEEQQKNIRPNSAFIKIQKYLIDMYSYKQKTMNLPIDQLMLFKKYLYIPENSEKIAEINRYLINPQEIIGYLNSKIYETNHNFILEPVKRETLNTDAYILLGYNMNQINNLNDTDLKAVNEQIYRFFRVDSNSPNSKELLDKAVNYYKRYGNRITTGNGYVDFLLFASIAATALFITILIALNYF